MESLCVNLVLARRKMAAPINRDEKNLALSVPTKYGQQVRLVDAFLYSQSYILENDHDQTFNSA